MDDSYFDTPKAAVASAKQGEKPRKERVFAAVLLGQLLSFLLALSGTISSLLVSKGISLPATQTVPNYALLSLVYGTALLAKRIRPVNAWTSYAAVSLLDVEGNFLVVLAFRYTFLTSVQLLNSFTVPCVFILSWTFLRARYRPLHCFGAALCLASLALLVLMDASVPKVDQQRPLTGDTLVLLGALAYAACNVAQEKLLRRSTTVEVLALMGAFGFVWSCLQAAALEGRQLRTVVWTPEVIGLLAGYTGALFAFYSLVPSVLNWSGAAILNLSLLSSNLWAALARSIFLGGFPKSSAVPFAAALVLVAAGLAMYACGGSVYTATSSEDCYRVIRCTNLEEPGDTPRKGPLLAEKLGGKSGASAGAATSVPSTPSGSSVQLAGHTGADPEASAPGKHGSRAVFSALFRGAGWGSPKGAKAAGARGPGADVEAGELATASSAEQAFRIWSLPNEGAITTDPYSKVGGSIERNEGKPPTRPG
ncbi:Solute carrier family 35 member F1 [Coccomyxa sp. Obi]|nr:Solute carrier family 35 member F1 [Coccomyxa sp. Obi]